METNKRMLVKRDEEDFDQSPIPDFKQLIDEKRRFLAEGGYCKRRKIYPLDEIANKLGIGKDMLQKRINKQKPARERDFVIALCAVLGMNSFQTSDALQAYSFDMHVLDTENPRDDLIIDYLEELEDDPGNVIDLNLRLTEAGLPKLHIIDSRGKNKGVDEMSCLSVDRSRILRRTDRIYDYGNRYESSLKHRYDTGVECEVSYMLNNQEDSIRYILTARTGKMLRLETWSRETGFMNSTNYCLPSESGDMEPYFRELIQLVKKRTEAVYATQFDSRNYCNRLSANIKDYRIHIFYEEYNHSVPERNEYYLMEYVDGHLQLSIAKQSMFMEEYLDANTYAQRYKKIKASRRTYKSLQEILDLVNEPGISSYNRDILSMRISAFKHLQKKVLKCLEDLRHGRKYVRDCKDIFDSPTQLISFYSLEKEFDCYYEETGELVANKKTASVSVEGKMILITVEQLERAFTLGFDNIEQIAHVIEKNGDFDVVLQ